LERAAVMSDMGCRRQATVLALAASFAVVAVYSLQPTFMVLSPSSPSALHPEVRLPVLQQGRPQMARAVATDSVSWAVPAFAVLAAGAVLASHLRDESRTTMYGKHDRKTFRGKLHAHTFGKYRLRKNKARRIQNIKNGTFDPDTVVQRGQPEPEHCWDDDNLMENPIYYAPDYYREAYYDYWDDVNEAMRKRWKDFMGKKGNQRYYKNWTPPGMEPPPEAAPEPEKPTPPPPSGSSPKAPEPEPAKEEAAPPAEEKAPEPEPAKAEEAPAPAPPAEEKAKAAAAPSAKDVKMLRERSRAGILDCKKALNETGGDMEKAMEWLKKKGMAKADKKAGNVAVEGCVASYVHFNNKIAVLVEVNSETDFVASNAIFKEFTADVAMQIAANSDVAYITVDDVPPEMKEKEKELEMAKEDLAGKPDNIKEKIVSGRLQKKFEEKALMNQKWLKDEDITVQEAVKQTIAKLGENIVLRRFERLTLGEGLEKKEDDFAAGVEKELAKYKADGPAEAKEEAKEEKKEETPAAPAALAAPAVPAPIAVPDLPAVPAMPAAPAASAEKEEAKEEEKKEEKPAAPAALAAPVVPAPIAVPDLPAVPAMPAAPAASAEKEEAKEEEKKEEKPAAPAAPVMPAAPAAPAAPKVPAMPAAPAALEVPAAAAAPAVEASAKTEAKKEVAKVEEKASPKDSAADAVEKKEAPTVARKLSHLLI